MSSKFRPLLTARIAATLWLLAIGGTLTCTGEATEQWIQRFEFTTNSNDYAQKVVVDNAGNVIVTGYTQTGLTPAAPADFVTIKYSNGGVPLWTNFFDGAAHARDQATALALDGRGNIFVTGLSVTAGSDPNREYVTIKYSAAGVPQWTNHYAGPLGGANQPSAIAVDRNGDVIVTGLSNDSFGYSDYATIKYSATGIPLWTNLYNGPANGYDAATAIATDAFGNVFVTGYSDASLHVSDYATIKYSAAGVPLWTNRYNGPLGGSDSAYALAVDSNGDVIVTGSVQSDFSLSGRDWATIKYSNAGAALWVRGYHGGMDSGPAALAIDGNGTVFVAGNAFVGGGVTLPGYDYATIAYSGAGVPLWTNFYNGPNNVSDFAAAIVLDTNGNVFVTGRSSSGFLDYATIAYSGTGVPLWTNRYDGPVGRDDYATSIAVDANSNVFVTGYSVGTSSNYDFVTIKYSTAPLVPIPLNYQIAGNQLVLSWTNVGFHLQSGPIFQGPYTNIPAATTPYTVPLSATQEFFRLKGN